MCIVLLVWLDFFMNVHVHSMKVYQEWSLALKLVITTPFCLNITYASLSPTLFHVLS